MKSLLRKIWTRRSDTSSKYAHPDLAKVMPQTMADTIRINSLDDLGRYVLKTQTEGDLVECGVCNGGSAGAIWLGLNDEQRRFWLYDSFSGMPETTEADGAEATKWVGKCVGDPQKVKALLQHLGMSPSQIVLKEGWFENSFRDELPSKVALLHCDADWYDSVMLVLETFYDRIPEGGVVILDDFGYWSGCRRAFYEFCHLRGIFPLLERAGGTQAFWIKKDNES